MYSIFDTFFAPAVQTVYVVSDSQLADLKRRQAEQELENLAAQREGLERAYQARVQVLDERVAELQKLLPAAAAPAEAPN